MAIELKVPAVGESITEVQIGEWLQARRGHAEKDENLVEIETDKATVELPAPVSGRIAKVLKHNGDTAAVGEVIGYMEEVGRRRGMTRDAAAAAQAQAADMIRTPAKRQAEGLPVAPPAADQARPAEGPRRSAACRCRRHASARSPTDGGRRRQAGRQPASAAGDERGLVVSPELAAADRRCPARRPRRPSRTPFPCRSPARRGAIARKKPCR